MGENNFHNFPKSYENEQLETEVTQYKQEKKNSSWGLNISPLENAKNKPKSSLSKMQIRR